MRLVELVDIVSGLTWQGSCGTSSAGLIALLAMSVGCAADYEMLLMLWSPGPAAVMHCPGCVTGC
jgi:hypothetical protein